MSTPATGFFHFGSFKIDTVERVLLRHDQPVILTQKVIIWHDLRRTFATRLRANGVHEYDIQDLLGHAKPGVTKVYARATLAVLEDAVSKLTESWGEVIKFERKAS